MTAKPEQPVLDAIDELVDWQLKEGRWREYCPTFPEMDNTARDEAIEVFLGDIQEPDRSVLRRTAEAGIYFGPEDFIDAFLAGRRPTPFAEDESLWTVRPVAVPGVVPRVR